MIYLLLIPIFLLGALTIIWTDFLLPITISVALCLLMARKKNDKFVSFAIGLLVFAMMAALSNSPF